MKLITKAIEKKLPPLYSQDGKGDQAVAYLKIFDPCSQWTWYATEYDPETGECFGGVQGFEWELGYFNLNELKAVKNRFGIGLERDMYWNPKTLAECKRVHNG